MSDFSIIIPVKEINDYVRENVSHILNLKNSNWELIILPNQNSINEWTDERIRIISSGPGGPALKRDLGAKYALTDTLVFLDDDSYPRKDHLNIASMYLKNEDVVGLGGPAITPRSDSFLQKVSGAVFLSRFSGGVPERYIPYGKVKEIDDWPSVNLIVKKKEFLEVGGFDSEFWPGEDTKLCLDITKKTGKKILYVPELVVWHHRREGVFNHLKQIGAYALHRGFFAKRYPETSRKIKYFIPSLFFLFNLTVIFGFFYIDNETFYDAVKLIYWAYVVVLILAFIEIRRFESSLVSIYALYYSFLTHLYYGLKFLQGLLTKELISKLR